jgi:hypothetical protein
MATLRAFGSLALAALAGCAPAAHPYRFGQPLLGGADLPPAPLGEPPAPRPRATPPVAGPLTVATRDPGVHVRRAPLSTPPLVTAAAVPAGEAAAAAIADLPAATGVVYSRLAAPHRLATDLPLPPITTPTALRALVGRRDARPPMVTIAALAHDVSDRTLPPSFDGAAVLAWADSHERRAPPTAIAAPGDLLIFDRAVADAPGDLVAVVIGRDARGVTEFLYAGGGVLRRGFLDVSRAGLRRDRDGRVVNTFLRTGGRWPPAGTHYLAGELLGAIVRRAP